MYPIVEWVLANLTSSDTTALERVVVYFGDDRSDLRVLILSWARHLGRIHAELDLDVDAPGAWVEWDLLQAILFRDWIERHLREDLDEAARPSIQRVVHHVDEWYVSWTEVDAGVMARVDGGDHSDHSGWWWNRIPPRGPIHEELVRYHGHVHPEGV